VRAAVETALRGKTVGDAALRDALFGMGTTERARMEGAAALGRAQAEFGKLQCDTAMRDLDEAEKQLGQLPLAQVQGRLAEIYKYREACARNRSDEAAAARFGAIKTALSAETAPASPSPVELRVQPEPEDATVYVDGHDTGHAAAPVAPGPHVVDVEKSGFRKLHRVIDVAPPGPVQLAVSLSPLSADPYSEVRAQVQGMRGSPIGQHLRELADLASRASADRVLIIGAKGEEVQAALFDPEAGVIEPRSWKGKVVSGTLTGLAEFATGLDGSAQKPATIAKPLEKKKSGSDPWKHWYTWVIAGGLAGLATALVVGASSSSDQLTIRSTR
jgi:PEGA domain-containing protein